MKAGAAASMAALLSAVVQVFTAAVGWNGTISTVVTDTPIFMIGVVITFTGFGIGLGSRLLHL